MKLHRAGKLALALGSVALLSLALASSSGARALEANNVVDESGDFGMWTPAPAPLYEKAPPSDPTAEPTQDGFEPLGGACQDGHACFWRSIDFGGAQLSVDGNPSTCCEWRFVSGFRDWWRSSKNRFANRKLVLGDELFVISCMDPGENRPSPGRFDRAKIGQVDSRCP